MVPVARRHLLAEKGRLAISVGGVGFAVLLILIVVALYRGWSRSGEVFEQLPGQLWLTQHGTSDPFHSVSLLEEDDLQTAASVPGVQTVVPVLSRQMTFTFDGEEQDARLLALEFEGAPVDEEQRYFAPRRGEIVIERTLSRKSGLDEGDVIEIGGVRLVIADVRPKGGDVLSQFAFVNFEDARQIFGVDGVVQYGMVLLSPGADETAVRGAIAEADPDVKVYTAEGFAGSVRKEIDESFIPVIAILVAIGFIVGSAVVGLTIYTATIERTREYGVMKAVGASSGFLYRIVLAQAGLLTAGGFAAGFGAALLTADLASRAVPEFSTEFRTGDLLVVLTAAVAMGIVASVAPLRRINSIDPAIVFKA